MVYRSLFFLSILFVLFAPQRLWAAVESRIIQSSADITTLAADYDATVEGQIEGLGLYRVSAESADLANLIADNRVTASYTENNLDARPSYFFATGDILEAVPSDTITPPAYTEQPAVIKLRLPLAHTISTGAGVTVAVLDTGIESDHTLLDGKVIAGYDFVDGDDSADDITDNIDSDNDNVNNEAAGHGTHVAGIIALVAPDAKLMPVRIFDSDGVGEGFTVAQGIVYAVNQGAQLINLSGNTSTDDPYLQRAIDYAHQNNVLIIASAGLNNIGYPASYSNVISVAATDNNGYRTVLSNFSNSEVTVYAPGEKIISAYHTNRYAKWTGHSMATPFVAGIAALMIALDTCDAACVQTELLTYARDVDQFVNPSRLLPDAYDAVGAAANQTIIDLSTQTKHLSGAAYDNSRKIQLRLDNQKHSLPLSELTLRYWYQNESNSAEQVICDWASMNCNNVISTFGEIENETDGHIQYLEIGFTKEAGDLMANESMPELHLRTHHTDWGNYDETDDYSYTGSLAYTSTVKVTAYWNGSLVWGEEPFTPTVSAVTLQTTYTSTNQPTHIRLAVLTTIILLISGKLIYEKCAYLP